MREISTVCGNTDHTNRHVWEGWLGFTVYLLVERKWDREKFFSSYSCLNFVPERYRQTGTKDHTEGLGHPVQSITLNRN